MIYLLALTKNENAKKNFSNVTNEFENTKPKLPDKRLKKKKKKLHLKDSVRRAYSPNNIYVGSSSLYIHSVFPRRGYIV